MNKLVIIIALILKSFNAPHVVKYAFFMVIKGKKIHAVAKLPISNVQIAVDLGEFIQYWIFVDGLYEKDYILQSVKYVENKVFIDIGSNIGVYALSLCKKAKQIYALEPENKNYKVLCKNVVHNELKNITPLKLAVFSKNNHTVNLNISNNDSGWHSLLIDYSQKKQRVKTITLDKLIKQYRLKDIGLIKIDVEGAEYDILKGSVNTLKKIHPVFLIEFNRPRASLAGHPIDEIYRLLMKSSYKGYRLKKDKLIELEENDLEKIYNENIFFI